MPFRIFYSRQNYIIFIFAAAALAARPAAALTVPAAPTGVTATAAPIGAITLTWKDAAANESGYEIQYTTDGVNYASLGPAPGANATSFTHQLTLAATAKYTYLVRAVNAAGGSAWVKSNGVSAAALTSPPAPSNVTTALNAAGDAVLVQWADNAANEDRFEARYTTDGKNFVVLSADLGANATSYLHAITSTVSMKYTYSVRAANAAGASDWVAGPAITVAKPTAPPAPTGVTASVDAAANAVLIQWKDNAANEQNYQIQYTTNGTTYTSLGDALPAGATSFRHALTSTSVMKYTYAVRATNATGVSDWAKSNGLSAAYVAKPRLPGPTEEYVVDPDTNTLTVNPIGDYTANLNKLLAQLVQRPDKAGRWALRLMPGTYNLTGPLTADRLVNADITSVDAAKPALLAKGANWTGEYILFCRHCDTVRVSYLGFKGKMSTYDPLDTKLHWGDQGVWFGSSKNMRADHSTFSNFGNAALRTNTELNDPALGVNSSDTWIEDNTFDNVWQVTTTTDNTVTHGGTRNYWFQRNTIKNLRGSIKFCSRTAGGSDAHLLNNDWQSSTDVAIELCSVNRVEVRGNSFQNIRGFILNAYTNTRELDDAIVTGFAWGDDITIADNVAANVGDGIRFSLNPYLDGYQPAGHRLKIDNNRITTVNNAGVSAGAIRTLNGPVQGIAVTNNKLSQVANRRPWSFDDGAADITLSGNTVDGVLNNTP